MDDASLIRVEEHDRVRRVTIDRPAHGNLITAAMMGDLRDAFRAAADADVLVLEGAGPDFTLGRDRADRPGRMSTRDSLALAIAVNQAVDDFAGLFVTAARGRALGFGSGLIVKSDLAVVSDGVRLAFDEIAHGFPPMIVMSYLGRHLLPRHALELVVTGRELTADDAAARGMVNRVVADERLEAEVEALLAELAKLDAAAVKRAKRYLHEIEAVEPAARSSYALRAQAEWFAA